MGKLDGKVAIVTGASRGIGPAIAILFAAEGAKVVCSARTLNEGDNPSFEGSLRTTVAQIEAAGGEAVAITCNVADWEECQRLVEKTRQTFGPVDVLVNNAALLLRGSPIADTVVSNWAQSFEVNVHGPFMLSKLVLPDMIERHSGAIVNVSSGAAIGPGRGPYQESGRRGGGTTYGATKAALERFTQGLAHEVYPYGISVTCYSPSQTVYTPGADYLGFTKDASPEPLEIMAKTALLLATEPYDKISGRVTYSQAILKEYGWIQEAHGIGIDRPGSGYSQI